MEQTSARNGRRKRICDLVMCALSAALCIGLPAAGLVRRLLGGENEAASGENRTLAEFPVIRQIGDLWEFPADFENWFSDHLFFKDRLVELKSEMEIRLFGELESDEVILGTKKPWLFHCSSDGQPLETYKKTNYFTDEQMGEIAGNLSNLQSELNDAGIRFILMISPDKEQVYGSDYMPARFLVREGEGRTRQLIDYLRETVPDLTVVYPRETLAEAKNALDGVDSLYYESDTHWNKAGAYLASEQLLGEIGRLTGCPYGGREASFAFSGTVEGDLQRMVRLGESYNSREYEAESRRQTSSLREIRDGNNEVILETSECDAEGCLPVSVYLCGDSFRWNLGPWIKEGVSRADIASRYYFDTEDLAEREPQVFVYMIAERYLHELAMIPGYNTVALPMPVSAE